jgi:glycosyltransferase involved in cell wall biosynthesis
VLPSDNEALGLSIVEAMACGLPVVATNVGGIPEVVVDGKTGFLVPPRDPIALASKLATLVESEELRLRMGALAAEKARSCHSFKDCAENVIRAYNSLMS